MPSLHKKRSNAAHALFYRAARYKALVTLAVNGPLTVRELGRAIDSDSSSCFVMIEALIESGILYKSDKPGHRKYVALNKSYFAFEELRNLLLKLDERYPAPRTGTPDFRTSFPSRRARRGERHGELDKLFGSRVRTWFLTIIHAAGSLSRKQATALVQVTVTGAQGSIDVLVDAKLAVQPGRRGLSKPVYLNPKFFAYQELGALLDRVRVSNPMFDGLRDAAIATGSHRIGTWRD